MVCIENDMKGRLFGFGYKSQENHYHQGQIVKKCLELSFL